MNAAVLVGLFAAALAGWISGYRLGYRNGSADKRAKIVAARVDTDTAELIAAAKARTVGSCGEVWHTGKIPHTCLLTAGHPDRWEHRCSCGSVYPPAIR